MLNAGIQGLNVMMLSQLERLFEPILQLVTSNYFVGGGGNLLPLGGSRELTPGIRKTVREIRSPSIMISVAYLSKIFPKESCKMLSLLLL